MKIQMGRLDYPGASSMHVRLGGGLKRVATELFQRRDQIFQRRVCSRQEKICVFGFRCFQVSCKLVRFVMALLLLQCLLQPRRTIAEVEVVVAVIVVGGSTRQSNGAGYDHIHSTEKERENFRM